MEQYRPAGFNLLPTVVKNLLIINVLFFLASFAMGNAFGIDLSDILGLHYFEAEKFKPYQIITYMFMHGGFGHIFFNMFALWMFGYALENLWGPKRFLIYFLVTGMGAALIQYIVIYFELAPVMHAVDLYKQDHSLLKFKEFMESSNFKVASLDIQNHFEAFKTSYNALLHRSDTLVDFANHSLSQANFLTSHADSLGLSADVIKHSADSLTSISNSAIMQSDSLQGKGLQLSLDFIDQYRNDMLNAPVVVGASGAVFGILLAFGMTFPNTLIYIYFAIPVKAKWVVLAYGAIEIYSGISNNPNDNVAHFAHLGGMLFGFILIMLWRNNNKRRFNNYE
jgi:membrane associated rhomboid family serine protease